MMANLSGMLPANEYDKNSGGSINMLWSQVGGYVFCLGLWFLQLYARTEQKKNKYNAITLPLAVQVDTISQ